MIFSRKELYLLKVRCPFKTFILIKYVLLYLYTCLTFLFLSLANKQGGISKSKTIDLSKVRFYDETEEEDPFAKDFETSSLFSYDLLKWILVNEKTGNNTYLFEIHGLVHGNENKAQFSSSFRRFRLRIEKFNRLAKGSQSVNVKYAYSNSGLYMLDLYKQCLKPYLNDKMFEFSREVANPLIGSKLFQTVSIFAL